MRRILVFCLCALSSVALAQDGAPTFEWTTFVGGPGRRGANVVLGEAPGTIDLGDSPWQCGYARTRRAQISPTDWSVQRALACRRGEGTVTATASCRVHDGRIEEHAASLSLGTVGDDGHVTVTLSCRPATR